MKRRDFLASGLAATAALAAATAGLPRLLAAEEAPAIPAAPATSGPPPGVMKGEMLYRKLGSTGEEVSAIGLGGHHIGRPFLEKDGIALVRTAIDRGINFMDNCWDYHDGGSEKRMGKALKDGYRDKVFLMTKIDGRTAKSATEQLEESLKRLQTDRIDLLQFHEILRMEDADQIFLSTGALAAVKAAQKAGKVRYIGFTGHKDPVVHLRMLEIADEQGFHFDAVQMPLNVMDAHFRSFEAQVVPAALKRKIGVLAMKAMGDGWVLKSGAVTAMECLHYALNLPASVVITGFEKMEILDQACLAVKTFKPMDATALAALLERTRTAAAKGAYELYKTSPFFDGTARNPEWLGYPKQDV